MYLPQNVLHNEVKVGIMRLALFMIRTFAILVPI